MTMSLEQVTMPAFQIIVTVLYSDPLCRLFECSGIAKFFCFVWSIQRTLVDTFSLPTGGVFFTRTATGKCSNFWPPSDQRENRVVLLQWVGDTWSGLELANASSSLRAAKGNITFRLFEIPGYKLDKTLHPPWLKCCPARFIYAWRPSITQRSWCFATKCSSGVFRLQEPYIDGAFIWAHLSHWGNKWTFLDSLWSERATNWKCLWWFHCWKILGPCVASEHETRMFFMTLLINLL